MGGNSDVLILGGGVIGLTTAYYLARGGVRVTVTDKSGFGQEASWAGAGILPPGNPERAATPYDRLRGLSASLFPSLSAELRESTGIDNGYLRCGGLDIGDDAIAADVWRAEGIAFEKLDANAARRLEPGLAANLGPVFHLPDLAQLRNPRHVKALMAACTSLGVRLQPGCAVHGFERRGQRVMAAHTDAGSMTASRFLLATGAWTEALLTPFGVQPGVRPVRGQIALLRTPAPLLRRVVMQDKCYLVPRADGRVLVGATEEDAGFDKVTTAGAIAGLLSFAQTVVPGTGQAEVERCWAGLRPGSPDGRPFLGPVPGCENLFVAAGHFRAGLQLSPATGTVLQELLMGKPLSLPIDAFRLDRPPMPGRVAFRS
jgi:glycine oxidase